MGGDGHRAEGLPVSLKVKNTFIDVNSSFVEDDTDGDDAAFLQATLRRQRQVSEPVPCIQRQLSGGPFYRAVADVRPPVAPGLPATGLLEEEEAEADELEEDEEPETEKDPCWVLDRQETEPAWPMMPLGRQETEQCWPSWGMPAGGPAHDAAGQAEPMLVRTEDESSAAANMWLFQLPGMEGTQPASQVDGAAPHSASTSLGPWPGLANPLALYGSGDPGDVLPGAGEASLAGAAVGMDIPPPEWAGTSTIMMRNLPNKYTQQMLLEELNEAGFQGTFDFMYLPIDPETHANRGYSFINFTDPSFAWMLKVSYEGRKMSRFNSDKVVSVAPAALQGFEANYAHYSTARVNRGDPAARPLFLCESRMRHLAPRHDGGRRRGGRRNSGSLIDLAAKQQQQQQQQQRHHQQRQHQQQQERQAVMAASATEPLQQGFTAAPPTTAAALRGNVPSHVDINGGRALFSGGGAAREAAQRPGAAEHQTMPKFCPYCGGKCQPSFRFCQFCGASLGLCL